LLDRRRFTFGSLLLLVSGAAAAASDVSSEVAPEAPPGPVLAPSWSIVRVPDSRRIFVFLTLHNDGPEPIEVLTARGRNPATRVTAEIAGRRLHRVVEIERSLLEPRIGPLPRYRTVAAGGMLAVGPYGFELPSGREAEVVTVQGEVEHATGVVSLAPIDVLVHQESQP
jgi:hypothetical protein